MMDGTWGTSATRSWAALFIVVQPAVVHGPVPAPVNGASTAVADSRCHDCGTQLCLKAPGHVEQLQSTYILLRTAWLENKLRLTNRRHMEKVGLSM